jgi:hypothetical protein
MLPMLLLPVAFAQKFAWLAAKPGSRWIIVGGASSTVRDQNPKWDSGLAFTVSLSLEIQHPLVNVLSINPGAWVMRCD